MRMGELRRTSSWPARGLLAARKAAKSSLASCGVTDRSVPVGSTQTPVGKGMIEPGPPTSSQDVGLIVEVIRSIRESKSGCAPPPCLAVRERNGAVWHCELRAPTPDLVAWLYGQPVADILIGPPNLETIFRAFYGRSEGGD